MLEDRAYERFESFLELSPGWMDGYGEAISPAAVEAAKTFLEVITEGTATFYPSEDGGVGVEILSKELGAIVVVDFFTEKDPEHSHGDVFVMRMKES